MWKPGEKDDDEWKWICGRLKMFYGFACHFKLLVELFSPNLMHTKLSNIIFHFLVSFISTHTMAAIFAETWKFINVLRVSTWIDRRLWYILLGFRYFWNVRLIWNSESSHIHSTLTDLGYWIKKKNNGKKTPYSIECHILTASLKQTVEFSSSSFCFIHNSVCKMYCEYWCENIKRI